jgi:hypothetical protein
MLEIEITSKLFRNVFKLDVRCQSWQELLGRYYLNLFCCQWIDPTFDDVPDCAEKSWCPNNLVIGGQHKSLEVGFQTYKYAINKLRVIGRQ